MLKLAQEMRSRRHTVTTEPAPSRAEREAYASRVRGSLLGGAIGDALGAPVEFWRLDEIRRRCGEGGVTTYVTETVSGREVVGRITDDTQMTLFTLEGMIRASVRADRGLGFTLGVVHHAYDRWLDTQQLSGPDGTRNGWLIDESWLYSRRAPGNTCLTALEAAREGERRMPHFGNSAHNESKGCGGVMRSAPFGLVPPWSNFANPEWQYDAAAEAAGFTHGHPTGKSASGALALVIRLLVHGMSLAAAAEGTLRFLRSREGTTETALAIEHAVDAARRQPVDARTVEQLGAGWVAEEALAIAIYAALAIPEEERVADALALAVSHSGDSDSTGAICGNILGALHGETALPPELAFEVEGRGTLLTLADDFIYEFTAAGRLHGDYGPDTRWCERYPGG